MRLVLIAACGLVAGCTAMSGAKRVDNGGYPVVDYVSVGERMAKVKAPYVVDVQHGRKHVVFIGCEHEAPPSHPQFTEIADRFASLSPQVAFNEGGQIPADRHYATLADAIAGDGETGVLKFHSDRTGIPMLNGDLDARTEFALALKRAPKDQLFLYYVIERLAIPFRYGAYPGERFEDVYARMVPKYFVGNGFPLSAGEQRIDYLKTLYKQYLGQEFDVAHFDLEAFDYVNPDCRFCAIGRTSKMVRDHELLAKIDHALDQQDRVIVVFGHGHALAVEPALKAIVAKPRPDPSQNH